MSDDGFKKLKDELEKEFDVNSDLSGEEFQNAEIGDREKAAFLHVFKCFDATVLDMLLSRFDELREVSLTEDQIIQAWRNGQEQKSAKDEGDKS